MRLLGGWGGGVLRLVFHSEEGLGSWFNGRRLGDVITCLNAVL